MWFTSALQTKQTTSLKQNKNELQSAQFMMIVFTWKIVRLFMIPQHGSGKKYLHHFKGTQLLFS